MIKSSQLFLGKIIQKIQEFHNGLFDPLFLSMQLSQKRNFIMHKKFLRMSLKALSAAVVLSATVTAAPGDDDDRSFIPNRPVNVERKGEDYPRPVTGLIYNIRNRHSQTYLDSNGHDVYYNPVGQGNVYQQWSLLSASDSPSFNLWHRQSGGRLLGTDNTYVQNASANEGNDQRWAIYKAPRGPFFNIRHRGTKNFLEMTREGRTTLGPDNRRRHNLQRWSFVPAHYELRGVMRDFHLDADVVSLLAQHREPLTAAIITRVRNDADVERTISTIIQQRVTDSYRLDFTRNEETRMSTHFTVEASASGMLGVFGVAGRTEAIFNWEQRRFTEEYHSRNYTTETTFSCTETTTVPPHQSVEVQTVVAGVRHMQVPFSAVMDITGYADRLRSDGRTVE